MKKLLLFIGILYAVLPGCSQEQTTQLDHVVSVYAKQYKFNGSVLVARKGKILLNKGYGYRNWANKVLNNEQTIYQLGSITKQFTSAVILKLQEEKKLDIKDKISKYFPQYPKGDSISIEQLLTHTSGIYNYTNDPNFMTNEIAKPANREKMMALFKDKPLDFSPGTSWSYSNSGYSLLGYIIEIASGKPYEKAVHDYIFSPLQMTHSGFDFTDLKSPEKATGYFSLDDSNAVPSPIVDSSVSFSAGAIYSTTGDLYKWHQGLENYSILTQPQEENAFTPVKQHYGFGWGIDSIAGKRRVGHEGGIHGFTTIISRVPADDVCIILLSNSSSRVLREISEKLYAILYNKPYELPKEKIAIAVPQEKLKEYIGEYELRPNLIATISFSDGKLMLTAAGQNPTRLYAEKEDYFFLKPQDNIGLEFKRNEKKEVSSFILHQDGQEFPCKKIR